MALCETKSKSSRRKLCAVQFIGYMYVCHILLVTMNASLPVQLQMTLKVQTE